MQVKNTYRADARRSRALTLPGCRSNTELQSACASDTCPSFRWAIALLLKADASVLFNSMALV